MNQRTEEFLKKHNLTPQSVDMDATVEIFLEHMAQGLAGNIVDVDMIPNYIAPPESIPADKPVIVLDAGGTNLRSSLVSFDKDGNPVVEDFRKVRMPGSKGPVTDKEFFNTLADQVERLIDRSDLIGFCFSYAVNILPDHDGVPTAMSKELQANIKGMKLGKSLLEVLASRGHDVSSKKIAILNDTVTTLLAAASHKDWNNYDTCVGFILGTGLNTAYVERNERITKLGPQMKEGWQIINEESGAFDVCPGDIDKVFFESTQKPYLHHLEKLCSGAYLGPLCFMATYVAVREEVLSASIGRVLESFGTFETPEVSMFLAGEPCRLGDRIDSEEDAENLRGLFSAIIERAGKLVAADLAATILATGKGGEKPVLINADGTTFYKTTGLRDAITGYLGDYLSGKGVSFDFVCIENSPTIGSAIGAMSI